MSPRDVNSTSSLRYGGSQDRADSVQKANTARDFQSTTHTHAATPPQAGRENAYASTYKAGSNQFQAANNGQNSAPQNSAPNDAAARSSLKGIFNFGNAQGVGTNSAAGVQEARGATAAGKVNTARAAGGDQQAYEFYGGKVRIYGPDAAGSAQEFARSMNNSPSARQTMENALQNGRTFEYYAGPSSQYTGPAQNPGKNSFSTVNSKNAHGALFTDQLNRIGANTPMGRGSLLLQEMVVHGASDLRHLPGNQIGPPERAVARFANETYDGRYGQARKYYDSVVA
jgi:hypothetical protein